MANAPLGVRLRRGWRQLRTGPISLQVLAGTVALLLVADVAAVGANGSSSNKSSNTRVASGLPGGPGSLGTDNGQAPGDAAGTGPAGATGASGNVVGGGARGSLGSGGSVGAGGTTGGVGTGVGPGGVKLTASDRGVTPTSIRVVFPWPNLGAVSQVYGVYGSSEDEQTSIQTFVDDVNAHGGVFGRKIDPEIVSYNPLDDSDMRSKCLHWTQDEKVFAVVTDGAWHDAHQLCVTQEGHTPLIGSWTTTTHWTDLGKPYLWWTGPDQADVVRNLAVWGRDRGFLSPSTKLGVVYADRKGVDDIAFADLKDALGKLGIKITDSKQINFSLTDTGTAQGQAADAVTEFKNVDHIDTVIPLLPYNSFLAYLQAAKSQNYDPRLLLSDYEQTLVVSLGLAETPGAYEAQLQDMQGPTTEILGNSDDTRGYNAQEQSCYAWWKQHNPNYKQQHSEYNGWLESTGTAMTWCQNIRLFKTVAESVGADLTRTAFDDAFGRVGSFQGTLYPDLSYGPNRHAGPHEVRTVSVHVNHDKRCPKKADGGDQGSCWMILQDFQPMLSP